MSVRIQDKPTEELVEIIIRTSTLCSCGSISTRRHNALARRERKALVELRRRGAEAEALIFPLLNHNVDGVRVTAAYFLLPVYPKEACETLAKVEEDPQTWMDGSNANAILELFRSGELNMI